MRHEHQQNEGYGIGSCVSRSDVLGFGDGNQRAERGSRSHSARNRAEVIQQAEFEAILCDKEAYYHGNESHNDSVQEHDGSFAYEFEESESALEARTCKEEHESEFSEHFESGIGNAQRHLAYFAEVSEQQSYDKIAARRSQIENDTATELETYRAYDRSQNDGDREYAKTELIELEEFLGFFFCRRNLVDVAALGRSLRQKQPSFFIHIRPQDFGHELNEENHSEYAERISRSVSRRNDLFLCVEHALRRRKSGSGSERTHKQARSCSRIYIGVGNGNNYTSYRRACDYHNAQNYVGDRLALEVTEEFGTRDKTYRGDKQCETDILYHREARRRFSRVRHPLHGIADSESIGDSGIYGTLYFFCNYSYDESHNKDSRRTQRNALYLYSADEITEHKNKKNSEQFAENHLAELITHFLKEIQPCGGNNIR